MNVGGIIKQARHRAIMSDILRKMEAFKNLAEQDTDILYADFIFTDMAWHSAFLIQE